jgi:putative ABC transport system permease protein
MRGVDAVRLGLAELARVPGRFALVVAATTLLIALVLVFSGIGTRHVADLSGAVARSNADVLVLSSAAQGAVQASRVDGAMVGRLATLPSVGAAAPVGEARVGGWIDGRLYDVSLWGAVPAAPGAPRVVAGRAASRPGEAVVDIADTHLGLGIGATLEVADTGDELRVVGLTEGRRFASIPTVTVTYHQWAAIIDGVHPDADEVAPALIAVAAASGFDPEDTAAAITAFDPELSASTPQALAADLPGVAGVRASFAAATLVALVAVSATVGLFFLVSVAHRRRSLALLRAVGAPPATLGATLFTQVAALVGTGSVLAGALVAVAAHLAPARVPLVFSVGWLVATAAATLAVALLSTAAAVRLLRRVDPAEAMGLRP